MTAPNLTVGCTMMRRDDTPVRIDRIEGDAVHWSRSSDLWWMRRLQWRAKGQTLISEMGKFFKL
jgi:hypothetical protein